MPPVDSDIARLFPLCSSQNSKSPDLASSKFSSHNLNLLGPATNMELVNSNSCSNLTKLKDLTNPDGDISDVNLFRVPSFVISDEGTPTHISVDIPIHIGDTYESDKMTIIDTDIPYTVEQFKINEDSISNEKIPVDSPVKRVHSPEEEDKDLSDVLSAMSNEECSLASEPNDPKPFEASKEADIEEYINHIDSPETSDTTCPNSETIHGESIMDDMSSVLGQDLVMAMVGRNGDVESTFTDETTLFTSETTSEIPLDSRNPSLEKYDDRIFNFLRRVRKSSKELEEKFGFENKVFNLATGTEPIKYCSLAQFVEGNDIARKSFKRHLRHSKKSGKPDTNLLPALTLNEELETLEIINKFESMKGSCSNLSSSMGAETVILDKEAGKGLLNARLKEDFDIEPNASPKEINIDNENDIRLHGEIQPKMDSLFVDHGEDVRRLNPNNIYLDMDDDDDDLPKGGRMFPRVSVVVEPPSPSSSDGKRGLGGTGLAAGLGLGGGLGPPWPRERRCSDNGPRTSLDVERCSSATRRISCGSLFQPGEADRLESSFLIIFAIFYFTY